MIELALGCARAVFTDRRGGTSAAPFDSHEPRRPRGRRSGRGRARTTACSRRELEPGRPGAWVRPFHVHGVSVLEVGRGAAPTADRSRRQRDHRAGPPARRARRRLRADRDRERHRGRGGPRRVGAARSAAWSKPGSRRCASSAPVRCAPRSVRASACGTTSSAPTRWRRSVARFGDAVAGTTDDGQRRVRSSARAAARARRRRRRRGHRGRAVHVRVARPLLVPARRSHRPPGRRRGEAAVSASAIGRDRGRRGAGAGRRRGAARRARTPARRPADRRVEDRGRAAGWPRRSPPGLTDLGENRAQELLAKAPVLAARPRPADLALRGPAPAQQGHRARAVGPVVALGGPVRRSVRRSPGERRGPGCSSRSTSPRSRARAVAHRPTAPALVDALPRPRSRRRRPDDGRARRPVIAAGGSPRSVTSRRHSNSRELSMGMSDDFEAAIEEGATMVRVGRAIFGERSR